MKLHHRLKDNLFVLFCFIIMNFTHQKIGPIKSTELILILLLPAFLFIKTHKYLVLFIVLFGLFLFKTLFFNLFESFEYFRPIDEINLFKRPYIISISRFVELLCCILFANLTYHWFKRVGGNRKKRIILGIINLHATFCLFLIFVFGLSYLDLTPNNFLGLVYEMPWDKNDDTLRLRGFFVEGGPFGLMLSMVFILTFYYKNKHTIYVRAILFFTIIFLTKSKAGMACILFWIFYWNWNHIKGKLQALGYVALIPLAACFLLLFSVIGKQYIDKIRNLQSEVELHPNNGTLLTGRSTAAYMGTNMILDRPILGIGMGNYPYNRNKEEYRGFVPEFPEEYILPRLGLGGIYKLLLENGFIGLLLFALLLRHIFVKTQQETKKLIVLFVSLFLFGVEMTFIYPYLLLAILLSKDNMLPKSYG